MSITALVFWITIAVILVVLAFGAMHYRIEPKTDIFYSTLLLICVIVLVISGVSWVILS